MTFDSECLILSISVSCLKVQFEFYQWSVIREMLNIRTETPSSILWLAKSRWLTRSRHSVKRWWNITFIISINQCHAVSTIDMVELFMSLFIDQWPVLYIWITLNDSKCRYETVCLTLVWPDIGWKIFCMTFGKFIILESILYITYLFFYIIRLHRHFLLNFHGNLLTSRFLQTTMIHFGLLFW